MSKLVQLKVGDRVKLVKRFNKNGFYWHVAMLEDIGGKFTVIELLPSYIKLSNNYWFPRESLRKLRSKP